MFDRFEDEARKSLGYARQEAQRFNHDYIGTEHMLLGILRAGGVGREVLDELQVDAQELRTAVEGQMNEGSTMVTMGQLPFTPNAKKVLELALEEAGNLGHNYIGTEHMLLGLIRFESSMPSPTLIEHGVEFHAAYEATERILGAPSPDQAAPTVAQSPNLDVDGLMQEIFRLHERVTALEATATELRERLRRLEGG